MNLHRMTICAKVRQRAFIDDYEQPQPTSCRHAVILNPAGIVGI